MAWIELYPSRGEDFRKEPESIAGAAVSHTRMGRLAGTTGGPWILVVCLSFWGHGTYIGTPTQLRASVCKNPDDIHVHFSLTTPRAKPRSPPTRARHPTKLLRVINRRINTVN